MFLSSLPSEIVWYPFLFDTPFSALRAILFWVTVLSVISYLVCLFCKKGNSRKSFLKASVPLGISYLGVLCLISLTVTFLEDGMEWLLFLPLSFLLLSLTAWTVCLWKKLNKKMCVLFGILTLVSFVAVLACVGINFLFGDALEKNWLNKEDVDSLSLYAGSILSIVCLLLVTSIAGKKEDLEFDARSITYAGICIAMSFALSYLRIMRLPQGGSITPASLLPLMLYAYLFGVKKGVFAGLAYGLLQALQDPTLLHPAQFLLDYPVAFSWIGLAGLFKSQEKLPHTLRFSLGALAGGLGRFAMHWLSGAFAFGTFAPEGTPALLYSFFYQAGYVLPDLAIAIVVGFCLFSSKNWLNFVRERRHGCH